MAQRIRSCTNSTNFDTINCDSYLPRLLKRDKAGIANKPGSGPKSLRDPSVSNLKTSAALVTPPNLKSRSGTIRQQNLQPVKTPPNPTNLIHKELLSDNSASVEVTVRTHSNRQPCIGDSKSSNQQPWGKLLKSVKSSETLSSFSNFDPLRTLHFLAKELRSKLKAFAPKDPNILQMVSEMEHALNRIPHEIVSTARLHQEIENLPLKRSTSEIRGKNGNPSQHQVELSVIKPLVDHKSCQTINSGNVPRSEIFHKQLEASADKLEATYKAMEKLCSQLKSEKEEIELLLFAEKDTVKFLRKQIEVLETEKTETRNIALEKLVEERDNLQSQVKRLQAKIDCQGSSSVRELKSIVQELQKDKARIEQENLALRHKLTLCSMEKEKYVAILDVRDRQINEIRAEMNQLQEVITEQLTELQRSAFNSSPSTQNTVLGNFAGVSWQQMQATHKHNKESTDNLPPSSIYSESAVRNMFEDLQLAHSSRELPSEDSSTTNLECVTLKMKRKVYESGISPPKVFKLFSSANAAAGI